MKDIQLDFINKKMINKYIDNQDRVAQQIKVAIRSWKKDFSLNTNFGVEYDVCWSNIFLMRAYVAEQIKKIPGVSDINTIEISRKKTDEIKPTNYFELQTEVIFESELINIVGIIGDIV